ncbi:exodeoxyribonuclease VII large subunit [Legionella jamestowniensis]|uniref:Exodeoxyribonuclease 7 large subunit n=1 Tax=Legionella jamestowniensis TaxID=455 RepID=A0A0W0UGS0_9GAMM|nr:exodeoxyribonuclease VII large subunit [Legionella jamestowniensis]KTD07106.1 exodeoxyribonuclease VII large subunit [Legionella jamestowniensis]SFL70973.1 Exodeoxyribonuclease VII large subunit [Legionella jamestowniensis DSM 19215]
MHQDLPALTVSQLNRQIRFWLENDVGEVAVLGELSNLSKPNSGHFYFTLKDASAQLRCVYFRNYHSLESRHFKDGQQVLAQGKLSLYEARGDYQLIVHSLSDAGLGELYRQFEALKAKLQSQGLFDAGRKKEVPRFPSIIGVITSSTGAALQDILTTLARRYPLATVKVYASEVQGKEASKQLIRAIDKANHDNQVDVLILARGGGSIEDLWAFNNEQLALAISNSQIPIVTGIGHETDFTIADFVADLRAATPTAAAEAVTPNQLELITALQLLERRAISLMGQFTQHKQLLLSSKMAKILSPQQLIAKHWQAIDFLERQLYQSMQHLLKKNKNKLALLFAKLQINSPQVVLRQLQNQLFSLEQQLTNLMRARLAGLKQIFSAKLATLHAVSPLATLDRGYAIATVDKKIIYDSSQVNPGDLIDVRLAHGSLNCEIINIKG